MTGGSQTRLTLAAIFGRLFENEFATLDGIALSCRSGAGMEYVDGTAALRLWLDDRVSEVLDEPEDPIAWAIHGACYEAAPGHEAVISGWSRHLRALLLEGYATPPATSMMRNRGVPDMAAHLVEPDELLEPALADTLGRARELAERNGMRHHLLITSGGYVVVSGAPPYEAMAHWHNVELAARVECLRIEDAALLGTED
jgi:hypothetical protein